MRRRCRALLLIPFLLGFGPCGEESSGLRLVWQDEFDGPAGQLPDLAKWQFDLGTDWGNAQLEYDTDRPENVSLDGNGNLYAFQYYSYELVPVPSFSISSSSQLAGATISSAGERFRRWKLDLGITPSTSPIVGADGFIADHNRYAENGGDPFFLSVLGILDSGIITDIVNGDRSIFEGVGNRVQSADRSFI